MLRHKGREMVVFGRKFANKLITAKMATKTCYVRVRMRTKRTTSAGM